MADNKYQSAVYSKKIAQHANKKVGNNAEGSVNWSVLG